MHHATDNATAGATGSGGGPSGPPSLLLAMEPGIAERLFTDAHRARLATLTRTDPGSSPTIWPIPHPRSPPRSPRPNCCSPAGA